MEEESERANGKREQKREKRFCLSFVFSPSLADLTLALLPPPPSSSPTVYAAGNYTTAQFIKFGIPLQLLQFATVTVIFLLRPWKWILCGASVLLLVAVAAGIWLVQGAGASFSPLTCLRERVVLGSARKSGLFAGEKEKGAAGANGAGAAPKGA